MNDLKFSKFFDKIAWAALTSIALYASSQLSRLSESMHSLSTNFAVMVAKMEAYEMQSNDLKSRISSLEQKVYLLKK